MTVSFTDDANNAETLTSAEYPATGNVRVGVPGPPQNLAASPGVAQVTLTWQAPQSNGGSPIESYSYRVSADGGRTWNPDWTDVPDGPDADDDPANETTLMVTGLRFGTEYTFEMDAYNGTQLSYLVTAKATTTGLSVAVDNASIAEDGGTSEVTVTTPTAFSSDWPVTLELSGTATETDDYTVGSKSLTFTAGATEVSTTVTAVQDTLYEASETVIVATNYGGTATIAIDDDDDAPTFSVAVDNDRIPERYGEATVTSSISNGVTIGTAQTIRLEVVGGTTAQSADYTISSKRPTLVAGATAVSATVTAVPDAIYEEAETVVIRASHGSTTIGSVTITIDDDEDPPMLVLSEVPSQIREGETKSIVLDTDTDPGPGEGGSTFATAQTITINVSGTATEGEDFTVAGSSTSFRLDAGTEFDIPGKLLAVRVLQDIIDDDAETVVLSATNGDITSNEVTITLVDDDDAPVLSTSVNNASIGEAAGTSTVTVGSPTAFASDQTITVALSGTAAETDDYTSASKSLTLGGGETAVTTTVTAVQDKIDDDAETVVVSASHGATSVGSATITITDDDPAPVLSLAVSPATVDEDGGTSTVTVSTGTGSTFETGQAVALSLSGTATLSEDYTIGATSLTLPAGVGTAASEISTAITAVDDDFFGGTTNKQISVTGSRAGTSFGAARTVTILEDEDAPKLTLTLSDDSISENGASTTVTASVAPRTVDPFTVSFSITPTAPATAADYDLEGTLEFAALAATPTGTVSITANDNRVDRSDKTVSVTGASSRAYFRATDAVTLTLEDDDPAPAPVVGTSPIAEAGGESVVTVTTGSGSTWPEARTVVLTLSGAAVEDADYGIGSKSLLLPAGSGLAVSSVTTTVTGIDDIIDDDGDTILIDAAIGATAVGTQQSIAITDDDAAPVVTVGVSPDSISENGGTATVTVTTADGASTFATDQAVALALTGTAMDGDDYDIASNSLTLPAGVGLEHAAVTTTVTGLNDAIDEADTETILIDATRGGSPVGTQQTLQVTDDDAAPVLEFRSSATQIAENGGVATLTVTTGTGSSFEQAQTITVSAQDGTALRGSDYALGPAALTLPAGEGLESSSVTTTVTGLDDGLYEGQADQTLTVSAAHGSDDVGAPIMLSIADDEAPSRPVLVLAPASIAEDSTFANGRSLISATVSPPAEVTFWLKTCLTGDVDRISYRMRFVSSPSFSGDERCGMVEFAAGATSSVVTSPSAAIFGNDNTIADGSATVTLTGEATGFDKVDTYRVQPNPLVLAPAPLTLTVTDDDAAATTVTLTVNDSEVGEGEASGWR